MRRHQPDDWPLIGREPLVDAILAALAGPSAHWLVLTGPPGIGKSRLAAEIADRATSDGWSVRRVTASAAAATIPFGALAPLLPRVTEEQDPLTLLQSTQDELARSAEAERLLLWVDDAHLLDPGSATLVAQLLAAQACSVVATIRDGEPLADALGAAWRGDDATRVELASLSSDEVADLLSVALGPPVAARTAARLHQRSGGNPMMLRELVRAAVVEGSLSDESGVWLLEETDTASPVLTDLVGGRIGSLDATSTNAVEMLALADTFPVRLMQQLLPQADMTSLEERGIVTVIEDGRRLDCQLAHPLYGEVLRQSMPKLRRRQHHGKMVDAVVGTGAARREDVLRVASWSLDSDHDLDPGTLALASVQAQHLFDLKLAERLAQAALRSGDSFRALMVLGEVSFRQGRHDQALDYFERASKLATEPEELVSVASSQAHVLHLLRRDAEAWHVVRSTLATVPAEQRARLDGRMAVLLTLDGRPLEALDAAGEVLRGEQQGELPGMLRLQAEYVQSICLALLGRFDESSDVVDVSVARLTASPLAGVPPEQTFIGRVIAKTLAGRPVEAERDAQRFEAAMVELGDREGEATAALLRGRALLTAGDAAAALPHLLRAVALNRELADDVGLRWSLGSSSHAQALLGDEAGAATTRDELAELSGQPCGLFEPDVVQRGLAWAEVASGRHEAGRSILRSAAELAQQLGQVAPELHVRNDLLRMGDDSQRARLGALADEVEGPYAAAVKSHLAASASKAGEDLMAASEAFEQAGCVVEAAELATAAAAVHRAGGLGRAATAATRTSDALRRRCPGVRTPALLAGAISTPSPMTKRELEIAELAARQLSSAEIAAQLQLSPRTVENHLQRIYGKLGVSNRSGLAEILIDRE